VVACRVLSRTWRTRFYLLGHERDPHHKQQGAETAGDDGYRDHSQANHSSQALLDALFTRLTRSTAPPTNSILSESSEYIRAAPVGDAIPTVTVQGVILIP
jgi:hypothetical protein